MRSTNPSLPSRTIAATVKNIISNATSAIQEGVETGSDQKRASELHDFALSQDHAHGLLRKLVDTYIVDQVVSYLLSRSNDSITANGDQGSTDTASDPGAPSLTLSDTIHQALQTGKLTPIELHFLDLYNQALDDTHEGTHRMDADIDDDKNLTMTQNLVAAETLLDAIVLIAKATEDSKDDPDAWNLLREAFQRSEKLTQKMEEEDLADSVNTLKGKLGFALEPKPKIPQEVLDVYNESQLALPVGSCGTK